VTDPVHPTYRTYWPLVQWPTAAGSEHAVYTVVAPWEIYWNGDRWDHGRRVSGDISHVHATEWILRRLGRKGEAGLQRQRDTEDRTRPRRQHPGVSARDGV